MAWVTVPGSNGIWEFENTATSANTYPEASGTYSGGIRTFTFADGNAQQIYVRCRKVGETKDRGELSKDYYDAR
jgi:hypothetical protein